LTFHAPRHTDAGSSVFPSPSINPDFIVEPKLDGFRALAHINGHRCTLISRNGHVFKSWPQLAEEIAHSVRAHTAILDGEICCLGSDGTSNFKNLLFRREWPLFMAFELLAVDGDDLRALPLLQRKRRLNRIMPRVESRLRYVDHVRERGCDLFRAVCERDLEGIVGRWEKGGYARTGARPRDGNSAERLLGRPLTPNTWKRLSGDGCLNRRLPSGINRGRAENCAISAGNSRCLAHFTRIRGGRIEPHDDQRDVVAGLAIIGLCEQLLRSRLRCGLGVESSRDCVVRHHFC
jgi:bifunctional non-homologous end joining protein LigD